MMQTKRLFILCLIATVAGCATKASTGKRPAWIDSIHPDYVASEYLTGQGMANERAVAEDRARADLAKIFQVRVSEFATDATAFESSSSEQKESTSLRRNASRNVVATTDEVITGVEITDVWIDKESGNYHAFATLLRRRMTNRLRNEIQQLDNNTQRFIQQSRNTDELFPKIAAASKALDGQYLRAVKNRYYAVASSGGQVIASRFSLGELEADMADLLSRMTVKIKAQGENPRTVNVLLSGAVANSGMTVSRSGEYLATAELQYELLPKTDDWFWIRGQLVFSLLDQDGNSLGVKEWPLKVAATEKVAVRTRLFNQIESILSGELNRTIVSFAADTNTN